MRYRYVAVDIDGTLLDDHDRYDQVRLTKDICALIIYFFHDIIFGQG